MSLCVYLLSNSLEKYTSILSMLSQLAAICDNTVWTCKGKWQSDTEVDSITMSPVRSRLSSPLWPESCRQGLLQVPGYHLKELLMVLCYEKLTVFASHITGFRLYQICSDLYFDFRDCDFECIQGHLCCLPSIYSSLCDLYMTLHMFSLFPDFFFTFPDFSLIWKTICSSWAFPDY